MGTIVQAQLHTFSSRKASTIAKKSPIGGKISEKCLLKKLAGTKKKLFSYCKGQKVSKTVEESRKNQTDCSQSSFKKNWGHNMHIFPVLQKLTHNSSTRRFFFFLRREVSYLWLIWVRNNCFCHFVLRKAMSKYSNIQYTSIFANNLYCQLRMKKKTGVMSSHGSWACRLHLESPILLNLKS